MNYFALTIAPANIKNNIIYFIILMSEKLIIKRRKGNEVLPEGKEITVNLKTD